MDALEKGMKVHEFCVAIRILAAWAQSSKNVIFTGKFEDICLFLTILI